MDFREYFSLGDDPSLRDLKRAYAKKLKQTSPEKDPEGFQYLREVYEYAQSCLSDEKRQVQQEVISEETAAEIMALDQRPVQETDLLEAEVDKGSASVDGILRSLANGLNKQAMTYLKLMDESGELQSLQLRSELENTVINYLLELDESAEWPFEFVRSFVSLLQLPEQADSNPSLDRVLSYFKKKDAMTINNWSEEQYEHDRWASNTVHSMMVEVRESLFEHGQEAAIDVLNSYNKDEFFNDLAIEYYFVSYYFLNIDDYFPAVFPYKLAIEIENIFNFSTRFNSYPDDVKAAYNHYLARRKASELRNEKWQYFNDHIDTTKGLAEGLLFGFIEPVHVRSNAISVAGELENLIRSLEKDTTYQFEIGGDEHINCLNEWGEKARSKKISAFKSRLTLEDRRLNPFSYIRDYRNVTSDTGFYTFLTLIAACYSITIYNVFVKHKDFQQILNISLVFACVIAIPLIIYYFRCLYYSRWDSYFYRELSKFKSSRVYKLVTVGISVALLLSIIFAPYSLLATISAVVLLSISRLVIKYPETSTVLLVSFVPWAAMIASFIKYDLNNPVALATVCAISLTGIISMGMDQIKALGFKLTLIKLATLFVNNLIIICCVLLASAVVVNII